MTNFHVPIYDTYTEYVYSQLTVYEEDYKFGLRNSDTYLNKDKDLKEALSSFEVSGLIKLSLENLESYSSRNFYDSDEAIFRPGLHQRVKEYYKALDFINDPENTLPSIKMLHKEISSLLLMMPENKIRLLMENCFSETVNIYDRVYVCLHFHQENRYLIELEHINRTIKYIDYLDEIELLDHRIKCLTYTLYYTIVVHKFLGLIEEPFRSKEEIPQREHSNSVKSNGDLQQEEEDTKEFPMKAKIMLLNEIGIFNSPAYKNLPTTKAKTELIHKIISGSKKNINTIITNLDKEGLRRSDHNPYYIDKSGEYLRMIDELINPKQ